MVAFLKINLDGYSKSATIRLSDDAESILQAQFDKDDVVIHRLNFERKPKHFVMSHAEASAFVAAWTDYQQRVAQHAAEADTRLQTAINDAKALAASVHFDLDTLNIKMERDNGDASWLIEVKALSYHRWVYEHKCQELVSTVQEVLDYIKENVKNAESWSFRNNEWAEIVASYRRVFPLAEECRQCHKSDLPVAHKGQCPPEAEGLCVRCVIDNEQAAKKEAAQGEPSEITEARKLLKSSLHPTDWIQTSIYPGDGPDQWCFDNGQDGEKRFAMFNHSATGILKFIQDHIVPEQGESVEVAPDNFSTIDDEIAEPFGAFAGDC